MKILHTPHARLVSVAAVLLAAGLIALILGVGSEEGRSKSSAPPLKRVWTGGFEGGLHEYLVGPWNMVGVSGGPVVVDAPTRSGEHAARFKLTAGGLRQEIVPRADNGKTLSFGEGEDLYFRFSTRFANDWPVVDTWQLIAQWKDDGSGPGSPPIAILAGSYGASRVRLVAAGTPGGGSRENHDLGPLARGRWIDWLVRIRFSAQPTSSLVQVWRDGRRVLSLNQWRPSFTVNAPAQREGRSEPVATAT